MGSPNCLVRVQTKDSNEVTFLRSFRFQIFFQISSGKYTAVLSKAKSTRPEETMKNGVLIRSSLIPKTVFAFWIRYFCLVQTFQHGWRYCILRVQRKNSIWNFSKHFCFLIVTGLWVEAFLLFGRTFPKCCQYCILRV